MSLLVHVVGVHVVVIVLVALIICAWSLTLNHCIFENLFLVPCALCPVPCALCLVPLVPCPFFCWFVQARVGFGKPRKTCCCPVLVVV